MSPGVTNGKDKLAATVDTVPMGVKIPEGVSMAKVRISPLVALSDDRVVTNRIRPPESCAGPPTANPTSSGNPLISVSSPVRELIVAP